VPITEALSKTRNFFVRSNTGIVGSNLTAGRDALFSVFMLPFVGSDLSMDTFSVQRVLPTACEIHSFRLILMGNKPEDLIRKVEKEEED
jgi:hypothetical protein